MAYDDVGIWGFYSYHYNFVEIDPDGKVTAARFGASMASLIGFAVMIASWVMSCRAYKKWAILLLSSLLFLCFIFQLLPLLLLASDYCEINCDVAPGGVYVIVVAIFWLINSVIVAFMRKRRNRLTRNRNPDIATAEPVKVIFVNPETTVEGIYVLSPDNTVKSSCAPPNEAVGTTCTLPPPINPQIEIPTAVIAPEIKK